MFFSRNAFEVRERIITLSSLWVSRTGSASDWCALQEALYKCIDTIQLHINTNYIKHTNKQSLGRKEVGTAFPHVTTENNTDDN